MRAEELQQQLHNTLSVSISLEACGLMLAHLDFILKANENVNLTRITDPKEAIQLHICDSLMALELLEDITANDLIIDMGSGAGFPGIPLALTTGARTVLIEATQKKAAVLQRFVDTYTLGEQITVCAQRIEEATDTYAGQADLVTARALAGLPVLVELAAPLLKMGGRFIAYKGRLSGKESLAGDAAARIVGLEIAGEQSRTIGSIDYLRNLCTYVKIAEPSIKLPRRTGKAQKSPLA
jgi:16S rRNA (guanine527-N7)-methyltransferase